MRKYTSYVLAGLVLFLFSFTVPSKTVHEYYISVAGVKVGELVATMEVENDFTTYTLSSDVSVYLLHRYRVKDDLKAVYKGKTLQYATVQTSVGKNDYFSAIIWTKDHYDININAYKYQNHSTEMKPIEYSVAKIYFEQPPASASVFSEDYGVFSDVNFIEKNINQLVFLGKKDKFFYAEGSMVKADMQSAIKDFIITRK